MLLGLLGCFVDTRDDARDAQQKHLLHKADQLLGLKGKYKGRFVG
jgi:hypothetical protein